MADHAILLVWAVAPPDLNRAEQALAMARELDDPALLAHALIASGMLGVYSAQFGEPFLAEAVELAHARGDRWTLSQIFSYQAMMNAYAGDLIAARAAGEDGRDLEDALGERFTSRGCRVWRGAVLGVMGDLPRATEILRDLVNEAEECGDLNHDGLRSGRIRKCACLRRRRGRRWPGDAVGIDGRRRDGWLLR